MDDDLHDEIVRLEQRMDELAGRLESCRKFILTGRVAVAAGGIVLTAIVLGVLRFDPLVMTAATAALLGGVVAWGANGSTAREATDELAAAESERSALIEQIQFRVITGGETLH